jgi:hypothetical protein
MTVKGLFYLLGGRDGFALSMGRPEAGEAVGLGEKVNSELECIGIPCNHARPKSDRPNGGTPGML